MRTKLMRSAVLGALAMMALGSTQVLADTNDELKAEIAAQKARLEALEKKLDAAMRTAQDAQTQAQQAQAQAQQVKTQQAKAPVAQSAASGLSFGVLCHLGYQ